MEHLQQMWHAIRPGYPSQVLVPSLCGACICWSFVIIPQTCHDFLNFLYLKYPSMRRTVYTLYPYISYQSYPMYWHVVAYNQRVNNQEKREEIWLNPVTKTPTPTEQSKKQRDNIKTPPKTLITQLLRTDLGRSVGVTAVTQLVWLNRFTSAQPSH